MATYEEIAAAAENRAEETREQRAQILEQLLRRVPTHEVEPEPERKVLGIQGCAGISREDAEAIVNGADPSTLSLTADQLRLVMGRDINDLLDASFLERARAAANAVGRLVKEDGSNAGTCFMISPRLLITNHHVIPDMATATQFRVEFNYELDEDDLLRTVVRFKLAPGKFFLTDGLIEMDFTVVALGDHEDDTTPLTTPAYCPLSDSGTKHALGYNVNLVQHPRGEPKQVVVRENRLIHRTETLLLYTGDTRPGASGSPGFNDQWQVITLHHYGGPSNPEMLPSGLVLPVRLNEGIRVSAIVAALNDRRGELTPEQEELLDEALHTDRAPMMVLAEV